MGDEVRKIKPGSAKALMYSNDYWREHKDLMSTLRASPHEMQRLTLAIK